MERLHQRFSTNKTVTITFVWAYILLPLWPASTFTFLNNLISSYKNILTFKWFLIICVNKLNMDAFEYNHMCWKWNEWTQSVFIHHKLIIIFISLISLFIIIFSALFHVLHLLCVLFMLPSSSSFGLCVFFWICAKFLCTNLTEYQ